MCSICDCVQFDLVKVKSCLIQVLLIYILVYERLLNKRNVEHEINKLLNPSNVEIKDC